MTELPAKRQNTTHMSASTVLDSEWENHKSLLKHLYIVQNLTVSAIKSIMSNEHNFTATHQQYQKRFRHWKLNKNISEEHWLALSRALKSYGVAIDELGSQSGTADVVFGGNTLDIGKIKKAIYRYDTSLLNSDSQSDLTKTWAFDELEILLRNLISRYIIHDQDNQIKTTLPKRLVGLILGLSYTAELSEQLRSHTGWGLKRRAEGLPIMILTQDEKAVFTSCISSISDESTFETFFRARETHYHQSEWLAILQETDIGLTPIECVSIWLDAAIQAKDDKDDKLLATNVLMFALILCLMTEPWLRSGVMKAPETSRLLSVPSLLKRPQSIVLLQILLLTMANQGKSSLCVDLIASGVDPNAVRPYSVPSRGSHIQLTALQMCLGTGYFPNCKFEPILVSKLLRVGANPNICGIHGQNQPGRLICCTMLPIYLALKHPLPVFQALLEAGACVPAGIDLTTAIQEIRDAGVLSTLLPDKHNNTSIALEGGSGRFWYERYLCPLQAVAALGRQEIALKMLEKLTGKLSEKSTAKSSVKSLDVTEPSLGCSLTRLAQVLAGRSGPGAWVSSECSIFRTPLAYAILNSLSETVIALLESKAQINKSYFDYLPSNHSLRLKGLHFNCFNHYLHHTSASPLQAAVWDENSAAAQIALNAGAEPNYAFSIGISPLALAMQRKNQTIIHLLLRHGACISENDVLRCADIVRREKGNLKEQQATLENDRLIMELLSCRSSKCLVDADPRNVRHKIRQTEKEIEELKKRIEASENFIGKLRWELSEQQNIEATIEPPCSIYM